MRIFFNGCSITWGAELEEKEEQRYSTLIGHQQNAEVVNIAKSRVSNDWIVEKTISWFLITMLICNHTIYRTIKMDMV